MKNSILKKGAITFLALSMCMTMFTACGEQKTEEVIIQESATVDSATDTATETAATESTDSDAVEEIDVVEVDSSLPAADVAEQGYDHYDKAIQYSKELEAQLGPIPKLNKEIKIGYVCKTFENEFWRMQKEGAEAAEKALKEAGYNVTIDVKAAQQETDEQGQLAILNDMINQGYDGILMSPISDGNLIPGIENAAKNNIEMTVIMDAFVPNIDVTVGAWHYNAGRQAAEWINEKAGGSGEVAIIQGMPKSPAARERTLGFQEWFAENNPEIEIVSVQNADWDRMKAKEIADIWMKQYPDMKGIYCNNDTMAMGALEAILAAKSDCVVVGTDGTSEAIESIKAGELDASVNFYPYYMAQIGTEMLVRKIAGQEDIPKVIYAPQGIIDASNVNDDPATSIGWEGFQYEQ